MQATRVFFILIVFSLSMGFTQEPGFAKRHSYKQALELSDLYDRPIMLFFWNVYCDACERLKADVLSDDEVLSTLDNGFVVAWVDTLNPANSEVLKQYKIRGTPTLIFASEQQEYSGPKELLRNHGAPKEVLLSLLETIKIEN